MKHEEMVPFLLALDTVAEVFGIEISDSRKRAYFAALQDLPWPDLEQACHEAIRTEKYFPAPATLRELAGYASQKLPAAELAWQRLRNLETRYNRDALSDPITREVFEQMGGGYVLTWGFGNWELSKEDQKRREFISRYSEVQNARVLAKRQPTFKDNLIYLTIGGQ